MSRIPQDQFVDDDEEECCPLCVEEFDLSDKNFRPCPCGYQICQFCYNNIKTTMNGLCPACRRPYDDSTIEFKNITPEEMAKHKQQIAQKAKKNAQIRQKEAQKAEADTLSRKHLAGLRVVQKNLVYVTGLTPTIREDRLLDTLRGNDYFGQYGKIIKIVVSKARENAQHQQSVGVYVTFARKEDAEACIKAVDGSQNGDRTLRAQYGTTKYCSAYLRGEQCNNRNCMFLHEPGEDNDSFTRQDLSMMNSIQTQQPAQSITSRSAPPAHQGPAVAAAAPMNRQDSNDAPSPTHGTSDAPGLPATANWGSRAAQERRASRSTSASNPSPMTTHAVPAQASKPTKADEPPKKKSKEKEKDKEKEKAKSAQTSKAATPQPTPAPSACPPKPSVPGLDNLLKAICTPDFKFVFSSAVLSEDELKAVMEFPQLLDPNGGAKRRAMREKKEKELALQHEAEAQLATQQAPVAEREETEATAGGSLQLGGEPEESHDPGSAHPNRHAIAPPGQHALGGNLFGQSGSLTEDFSNLGLNTRGLSTQQQQQLLLSNFKSGPQSAGGLSNPQNTQSQQQGLAGNPSGHTRHSSRFSFANDSASASANVQPVANQKLMNQQTSMMPKNNSHFNQVSQHQPGQQFYTNVQGPPPGLKATGTPPVSGTGMFGQGHGFATGGLGYGANAASRNNDAMYQDLLRRNMDGGARVADAGKRGGVVDVQDPSILQARLHQAGGMVGQGLYGQGQDDQPFSAEEEVSMNVDALVNDNENELIQRGTPMSSHFLEQPRRATPTIPPGFSAPVVPKPPADEHPMSRNASSGVTPVIPIIPTTPLQTATSVKSKNGKQDKQDHKQNEAGARSTATIPGQSKSQPQTPTKSKKSKAQKPTEDNTGVESREQKENTSSPSPVKGTPRTKSVGKGSDATAPTAQKEAKDTMVAVATPASTKRQNPGKLNIAAATKPSDTDPSSQKADAQSKNGRAVLTPSSSVPSSAAVSTGSPIKRSSAPLTLRVLATPKTEVPPPLSASSVTSLPHVPTVDRLRSRQASIASVQQPGTPASDLISDTASVTSASISRTNSPPLGGSKVGTAPVRKKTKSQAKKERQERKRQIEEEQVMALDEHKSDAEVVQAPIVGRKKKTKKPANNPKSAVGATAAAAAAPQPPPPPPPPPPPLAKSQPPSPKPTNLEDEQEERSNSASTAGPAQKKAQVNKPTTPTPEPSDTAHDHPKDKREPNAQSIIADLQKTGELLASTLEFFKPLSSSLAHTTRTQSGSPTAPPDLRIHFSEADLEALAKKRPVHLNQDGKGDSRTLITPQGKFFWGLTQELEEKALELEKRIEELRGHAKFHPRKQSPRTRSQDLSSQTQSQDVLPAIATALQEAGKKLGGSTGSPQSHSMPKLDPTSTLLGSTSLPLPPVQAPSDVQTPQPPPPPQPQTPADAGAYLNQFVLPKTDSPSPNHPRTEMAAVGGPPGAGTANMSVNPGKFAKAAKAVVEGGAVGSTEIDGMGLMAADLLGGVVVQGLEALVGAGLGFHTTQDFGMDEQGQFTLGRAGMDVQGLVSAIETSGGLGGFGGNHSTRRGRGSVLSVEEAEQAMQAARKDHEALEKKLATLMKKNKKLVSGAGRT